VILVEQTIKLKLGAKVKIIFYFDHNKPSMNKHEIIPCERCGLRIECKANAYTKCQCSAVKLDLNEVQFVSESFDGCLCAACLMDLKNEYQQ
jgi:hypothetical protein